MYKNIKPWQSCIINECEQRILYSYPRAVSSVQRRTEPVSHKVFFLLICHWWGLGSLPLLPFGLLSLGQYLAIYELDFTDTVGREQNWAECRHPWISNQQWTDFNWNIDSCCCPFLELLYSRIEFCLHYWNIIFLFNTVQFRWHNLLYKVLL